MNDYRIAVVELPASKRNLDDAVIQVDRCLGSLTSFSGATLAVLPENFVCCSRNDADYEVLAGQWQKAVNALACLARRHGVYLVAGTLPEPDDGKRYITTTVFDPTGDMIAKYRKIHLFRAVVNGCSYDEGQFYSHGLETAVFNMEGVRVGLAICFDLRFPNVFSELRAKGADVIVVPAAFTEKTGQKHWHVLLRARAVENQVYVVGAGLNGSSPDGYECYGHSLIIDPDGKVVTETLEKNDFQVIEHKIDLELKEKIRSSMPLTAKNEEYVELK